MTPRWDQLDEEPTPKTCGECGHAGYHHPNCPMGDGDAGIDNREELQEEPSTV